MDKYTIVAPIPKTFTGYGLNFVAGVATTEEKRLADYLQAKGYKVRKENDTGKDKGKGKGKGKGKATPPAPPAVTPAGNPDGAPTDNPDGDK